MHIEVVAPRDLASSVADELAVSIQEAVEEHGRCRFALAGGGTPSSTYRLLSRPPYSDSIPWNRLAVFWGDERWVPLDHSRSNERMARETLLSHVPILEENIYPFDTSLSTPAECVRQYEQVLQREFSFSAEQKVVPAFDIVLLGLGRDGHTASIFPHSELLGESDALVAAVKQEGSEEVRITLAPQVLFSARKIFFIVQGAAKAKIVEQVFDSAVTVAEVPAKLYEQAAERTTWFIDSEAARNIEASLA